MVISTTASPRNAFCYSSTRGRALPGSSRPHVLPHAAPILSAIRPVGHEELPNSSPTPQLPRREQDTASPRAGQEGEGAQACTDGKVPSGGSAAPRQFPCSKPGLALRPGHVARLTCHSSLGAWQGMPGVQRLRGLSWIEAEAFPNRPHSMEEPSVTLKPSTAAST